MNEIYVVEFNQAEADGAWPLNITLLEEVARRNIEMMRDGLICPWIVIFAGAREECDDMIRALVHMMIMAIQGMNLPSAEEIALMNHWELTDLYNRLSGRIDARTVFGVFDS